jgi:hypothetical protein
MIRFSSLLCSNLLSPDSVWTWWIKRKFLPLPGIETMMVHPILNNWLNYESEGMWKEVIIAYFKVIS